MSTMPNLHIREVPPEAVEALRAAAKRNGRTLNAELVDVLVDAAEQKRESAVLLERLEPIRRAWRKRNPKGFPPGLEPETIIRRTRDAG